MQNQATQQSVNLSLTVAEVNVLLQAVAGLPYAQVAELIKKIMQQAEPQLQVTVEEQLAAEPVVE